MPTERPTSRPTPRDVRDIIEMASPGSASALDDPSSPQGQALEWILSHEDPYDYGDWRILQRWALAGLGYSTGVEDWDQNVRWMDESLGECTWQGIDCDNRGRVISIELRQNNLGGEVFPELFLLADSLVTLDLGSNEIAGTLPTEYGLLTELQQFNIERNDMEGRIPTEVGNMGNLMAWDFSFNVFVGTVPVEINNLRNLYQLKFHVNDLTGNVPEGICLFIMNMEADCRELTCTCCTRCWYQCGGRYPPCDFR
jgi:Leucine-rich repeat (LRR) protein